MEGYLDQVRRSKIKVTRSKNVHWNIPFSSESLPKEKLRNTTWGVCKAYVFFLETLKYTGNLQVALCHFT